MKVNEALLALQENQIALLQERARNLKAAGERVLDFSIGDPREPTPPFIPEALRRRSTGGVPISNDPRAERAS